MKLKCSEIPWYYQLDSHFFPTWEDALAEEQKGLQGCDGPARYLEVCDNPGLPEIEGIMFWDRIKRDTYQQYLFQEGKWFKSKELIKSYYDFIPLNTKQSTIDLIVGTPYKVLDRRYHRLKHFLEVKKDCREIYRSTRKALIERLT